MLSRINPMPEPMLEPTVPPPVPVPEPEPPPVPEPLPLPDVFVMEPVPEVLLFVNPELPLPELPA